MQQHETHIYLLDYDHCLAPGVGSWAQLAIVLVVFVITAALVGIYAGVLSCLATVVSTALVSSTLLVTTLFPNTSKYNYQPILRNITTTMSQKSPDANVLVMNNSNRQGGLSRQRGWRTPFFRDNGNPYTFFQEFLCQEHEGREYLKTDMLHLLLTKQIEAVKDFSYRLPLPEGAAGGGSGEAVKHNAWSVLMHNGDKNAMIMHNMWAAHNQLRERDHDEKMITFMVCDDRRGILNEAQQYFTQHREKIPPNSNIKLIEMLNGKIINEFDSIQSIPNKTSVTGHGLIDYLREHHLKKLDSSYIVSISLILMCGFAGITVLSLLYGTLPMIVMSLISIVLYLVWQYHVDCQWYLANDLCCKPATSITSPATKPEMALSRSPSASDTQNVQVTGPNND